MGGSLPSQAPWQMLPGDMRASPFLLFVLPVWSFMLYMLTLVHLWLTSFILKWALPVKTKSGVPEAETFLRCSVAPIVRCFPLQSPPRILPNQPSPNTWKAGKHLWTWFQERRWKAETLHQKGSAWCPNWQVRTWPPPHRAKEETQHRSVPFISRVTGSTSLYISVEHLEGSVYSYRRQGVECWILETSCRNSLYSESLFCWRSPISLWFPSHNNTKTIHAKSAQKMNSNEVLQYGLF